jgi:nucleotide-binding universal stress UspA family protein
MAVPRGGVKRIVVGVDGSEHGEAAIGWAVRMAKGMGSEVVAVFGISPPVYLDAGFMAPMAPPQYDPEWRAEIKKEFEGEWCKSLRAAGVKYRTVIEDGRPASVIAGVADRENADVIVVGRRGRGGVTELVLGSVSHELVLRSKRPVLVIESTATPGAARPARSKGPARTAKRRPV